MDAVTKGREGLHVRDLVSITTLTKAESSRLTGCDSIRRIFDEDRLRQLRLGLLQMLNWVVCQRDLRSDRKDTNREMEAQRDLACEYSVLAAAGSFVWF